MGIVGQIFSIIAMVFIILSFQCKSNRKLVIVMGTGAILFAISYFLLNQPTAAVFNLIAVVCSIMCLSDKWKNKFSFGFVALLYVVATLVTFEKQWSFNAVWAFVLMAAQIGGSYSLMFGSGKFIRNMRFFFVSPVWLINNTAVGFTIGGTICEIITMVSVIVSFIRYRKTGFEK